MSATSDARNAEPLISADWERWRGTTDSTMRSMLDRLSDIHSEMTKSFTEVKAKQDYTNGHVRELREFKARIEGREQGFEQGEQKVEVRVQRETADRRYSRAALWTAAATAATVCSGIAAVVAIATGH